jgi:hypothetical protein
MTDMTTALRATLGILARTVARTTEPGFPSRPAVT